MNKKRLIVVGNKEDIADVSAEVDRFDIVFRLNRGQTFCGKTGSKCDLFLLDCHGGWEALVTQQQVQNIQQHAQKVLVNSMHWQYVDVARRMFASHFSSGRAELVSLKDMIEQQVEPMCQCGFTWDYCTGMRPTNFFISLCYAASQYASSYSIWFTGIDVVGRHCLEDASKKGSAHKNALAAEEQCLTKMLDAGTLHMLPC